MTADDGLPSLLRSERQAALTRVAALEREFTSIVTASAASTDDEHDPEGATIAFERQHLAALLEQARSRLAQIDESLQRVADGSYGTCIRCQQPIPQARLAARPTAAMCTRCAAGDRGRR